MNQPPRQGDLEVFVRDASDSAIMSWLADVLGPLRRVQEDPVIYHADRAGVRVAVVIQPEVADGTYSSVYVAPNAFPWNTDADMARAAARSLSREVRCDPGPSYPSPWHWLRVTESGEEIINWDDLDEE